MGITSLQVCMDSSDWLQGTMHEVETGMDSSSPISGDNILTCSRPLIERRLRPPHDQALKCPRCDSTHTKFCYYNNYSLSQPRYFCKTCRRYWTKGGTLRNIPVGGGCRKNKKVSSKNKSNINEPNSLLINNNQNFQGISTNNNPTDLQLSSFPDQMTTLNFPHNFMGNYNNSFMLENHSTPIDFMESKYEALVGSTSSSRNQDHFLGNSDHNIGILMNNSTGFGGHHHENIVAQNFTQHAGFGVTTMDHHVNNDFGTVMDLSHHHQRLMLPNYETITNQEEQINHHDVKPNPKMLSLEWHHDQQGCSDHAGKESSFGYIGSNWSGLMNGYGSSATNPLV